MKEFRRAHSTID